MCASEARADREWTLQQTEQRPFGKSRNRSTSHHQWQIRDRKAWEGLKKEENEDRKKNLWKLSASSLCGESQRSPKEDEAVDLSRDLKIYNTFILILPDSVLTPFHKGTHTTRLYPWIPNSCFYKLAK